MTERAVAVTVFSANHPVIGASVTLAVDDSAVVLMGTTNHDGYLVWQRVSTPITAHVTVLAPSYQMLRHLPVTLQGGNQTIRFGDPGIPDPQDVSLPGLVPLGNPVPPVLHLHADGWDIVTETGRLWRMVHGTNFMAFARWVRGEEPPLYEGLDGYRILTCASVIPQQAGWPALRPENYVSFYGQFHEFQQWLLRHGKRGEFVGLADCVLLGWGLEQQRRHVARLVEILQGGPHLFELANENTHINQQVDSSAFARPSSVFACAGSSLSEGPCPLPAWDYSAHHLARRLPAMYTDAIPIEMILGYAGYAGTQGPTLCNETIGADETDQPGRRSRDPRVFQRLGGAFREWGGGTIHLQHGIFSVPLPERQRACVEAFARALR